MNSKFDYDMLKQKLEDMMANGEKVMDETKKAKAAAEEAKATATGELETASKTLSEGESHLKDLQQECMAKAEEYETSQHSRSEELTALEAAKEAAHKAFCDKEMSETKAKKEDKESDLEDLSTKIDKATSKIAKLTEA